jgi:hypothetical protein
VLAVLARPACVAHLARPVHRAWPSSAGPRNARRTVAQHAVVALHGEPMVAQHRRTGDGRGNGRLNGAGTAMQHDGDGQAARRPGRHGDGPGDAASDRGGRDGGSIGTAARGARRRAGCARQSGARRSGGGREGRDGAVGTSARGPGSAFNVRELHGAWHPRGNGALPRGPGAARDV